MVHIAKSTAFGLLSIGLKATITGLHYPSSPPLTVGLDLYGMPQVHGMSARPSICNAEELIPRSDHLEFDLVDIA